MQSALPLLGLDDASAAELEAATGSGEGGRDAGYGTEWCVVRVSLVRDGAGDGGDGEGTMDSSGEGRAGGNGPPSSAEVGENCDTGRDGVGVAGEISTDSSHGLCLSDADKKDIVTMTTAASSSTETTEIFGGGGSGSGSSSMSSAEEETSGVVVAQSNGFAVAAGRSAARGVELKDGAMIAAHRNAGTDERKGYGDDGSAERRRFLPSPKVGESSNGTIAVQSHGDGDGFCDGIGDVGSHGDTATVDQEGVDDFWDALIRHSVQGD